MENWFMRILLDVTETVTFRRSTGIQRVVREISAALSAQHDGFYCVVTDPRLPKGAVLTRDLPTPFWVMRQKKFKGLISDLVRLASSSGRLRFLANTLKLTSLARYLVSEDLDAWDVTVPLEAQDVVLLIDSFWNTGRALRLAAAARRKNARVVLVVHDFLPYYHPDWFPKNALNDFLRRMPIGFDLASHVSFTTQQVREDYLSLVNSGVLTQRPMLELMPLGVHGPPPQKAKSSKKMKFTFPDAFGLMVGSIEPRKGYEFLAATIERHSAPHVVIVGIPGWAPATTYDRLQQAEHEHRLTWLRNVDDALLEDLYQHCTFGLYLSQGEGFGLPPHEFAKYQKPLISTDIPVLRETTPLGTQFVQYGDIDHLSKLMSSQPGPNTESALRSWQDAGREWLRLLSGL